MLIDDIYKDTLGDKIRVRLDRISLFSNRHFNLVEFWDYNKGFIISIFLIIFTKLFILNLNIIPSSSMNPNLLVGDYVLVNKLKWHYSQPKVGDVVTFEVDENPYMVKRIVGKSGDSVKFYDGYLFINDKKLGLESYDETYVIGKKLVLSEYVDFKPFIETNTDTEYKIIFPDTLPKKLYEDTKHNYFTENIKIPEGEFFLAGDNRFFSKDSRSFKTVSKDELIGQPLLVIINFRLLKEKVWALLTFDLDSFIHGSWDLRFFESIQ
jgi:signal peptidase I